MFKKEQSINSRRESTEDYLASIRQLEDKNFDFIKKQNLKKLNMEPINEKFKKENFKNSNGKSLVDFSNDVSLDQVERKLNRFSIAKDSLESSLANLPYSIEVIFF